MPPVREAGWKIIYLPEAQVVHYVGKSSDQAVAARHIYFQTSKVHYFCKWHGAFQANLLRLFLLSQYLWQIGLKRERAVGQQARITQAACEGLLASGADRPEMRLGLITGEYSPQQGGVGDFTHELARALNAAGHEAQVVTTTINHQPSAISPSQKDGVLAQRVISSWGMPCWGDIAAIARQQQFELLNIQYEPAAYAMQVGVNFLPSAWVRRSIKVPIVTTFHDLLVPYLFPSWIAALGVVEYLAPHAMR
jgi:hypothetical protein